MKYRIKDREEDNPFVPSEFDCVVLFNDKKTIRKTVTYVCAVYDYIEELSKQESFNYTINDILAVRISEVGGEVTFNDIELVKEENENLLG